MIPFKDDNPTGRFPYVTVLFISINVAVFFWELFVSDFGVDGASMAMGAIPKNIFTLESIQPVHPYLTVFTSMFMHGGLMHLAGNMLYLWIFADNIENLMGPVRFVIFYLMGGVFAVLAHSAVSPGSGVPMVGASGAISAVLGAYLVKYPRAKIHTLMVFGLFIQVWRIPAVIVIGFWAVIQFLNGILSPASAGGVAWFAHIGGFFFGLVAVKMFSPTRRTQA